MKSLQKLLPKKSRSYKIYNILSSQWTYPLLTVHVLQNEIWNTKFWLTGRNKITGYIFLRIFYFYCLSRWCLCIWWTSSSCMHPRSLVKKSYYTSYCDLMNSELFDEVTWGSQLCQDVVSEAETDSKIDINSTCLIIQEDSLHSVTMKTWNFICHHPS